MIALAVSIDVVSILVNLLWSSTLLEDDNIFCVPVHRIVRSSLNHK